MNAAVVVHRWFERGAGWAYAPEAGDSILAIMSALDGRLKAGKPGTFQVGMDRGRYLVGTVANDPDCPDPKARARKPTILRAALLDGPPAPTQEQEILDALSQLWPTQPGADARLVVTAPEVQRGCQLKPPAAQDETNQRTTERLSMWKKGILIMAALGACAVTLWVLFMSPARPPGGQQEPDLRGVAATMKDQLTGWGMIAKDTEPDALIALYCEFLSQAELGAVDRTLEHPYVRFVRRLPEAPTKSKNAHWTDEEVRAALRAIIATLDQGNPPAANITAIDALSQIAGLMNYEEWRKGSRRNDPDGAFAKAPGNDVARYVERFRKGGGSIPSVVPKMQDCLRAWGVKEAEGAPEFTVLRLFCETLRRPSERLEGLTDADMGHAYWKFLSRLPEVSCTAWTGDSDKEVEDGIREVVTALGRKTDNQPVVNWIDLIRAEMNYDSWLEKQNPRKMITKGEPDSTSLRSLVSRFRQHKEDERRK